jgi:hypothetical protein
LRRYGGYKVRPSFLGSEPHLGSLNEGPWLKPPSLESCTHGPEGPCSLRREAGYGGTLPRNLNAERIFSSGQARAQRAAPPAIKD